MTVLQIVDHLQVALDAAREAGDKRRAATLLGRLATARRLAEKAEKSAKLTWVGEPSDEQNLADDRAEAAREEAANSPIVGI